MLNVLMRNNYVWTYRTAYGGNGAQHTIIN